MYDYKTNVLVLRMRLEQGDCNWLDPELLIARYLEGRSKRTFPNICVCFLEDGDSESGSRKVCLLVERCRLCWSLVSV